MNFLFAMGWTTLPIDICERFQPAGTFVTGGEQRAEASSVIISRLWVALDAMLPEYVESASSLLDSGEQPSAASRAHEGPQFSDFAALPAFNDALAGAFDHAVLERESHGHGRIVGAAFAPSFG